jgi:protein O-GlcNAc transferase
VSSPRSPLAPNPGRDNLVESLRRGLFAHQSGDLVEAGRLYKMVLRRHPGHFDALHLLGMLEGQRGRWDRAERLIGEALKQNGGIAEVWSNLGNVQHQRGRYDAALASFERALELNPLHPTALNNRGNTLLALGRRDEALASLNAAVTAAPNFAGALHNRGITLRMLERPQDALADFDQALALTPNAAQLHADRGGALVELGRTDEALTAFDRAIALDPRLTDALYNRGVVLLQQLRLEEALASFEKTLSVDPSNARAFSNRGTALVQLGRTDEALESFDRALHQDPELLIALAGKGDAALASGRYEVAAETFERLVARNGEYPYALGNLLYVRSYCCDWQSFEVLRALVDDGVRDRRATVAPGHLLSLSNSPEQQLQAARIWVEDVYAGPPVRRPPRRYGHAKIRLAYVSANFHEHAMPMLLAGLFEQHNRALFETTAISFGPDDGSAMRQRLTKAFDRFVDARTLSDQQIAERLERDEIDIAVDLMGYTLGSRPEIFRRRPADIQVSYMGYCGTTALDCIDYLVADASVIPEADRDFYTEKVAYLPDSYFGNDNTRVIAERTPSRAEAGLPDTGFVFCCFNNNYKFTPDVFAVWMRLLQAVDGSVLWMLKPNATAERNLRAAAQAHGVAPERLVFAARVPPAEHLARHRLAGLILDTLPYNAHTTACDALWAGVPVLTHMGDTFAGRVAASVLKAAGVPELITTTAADYEALALKLAREPQALAGVRDKIARHRDTFPLFDTDRFRRHMEAAYIAMHERHQRGEPPESFTVAPISPAPAI